VTEINFEEAIKKLEDEVKRLENGNMSLDESIASFEEAVKLVKICNVKLETAERKVAILTKMSDGTVTDLPFVIDDEA
jgi:exodeoxyribonuclease VII small subunit